MAEEDVSDASVLAQDLEERLRVGHTDVVEVGGANTEWRVMLKENDGTISRFVEAISEPTEPPVAETTANVSLLMRIEENQSAR